MTFHGTKNSGIAGLADRWMATLAHELRNPLHAIMLALDVLQPACADDADAREARDIAETVSKQMDRLVEDMLDLYRAASGKLSLRSELVNVAKVAAGAIVTVRPLLAERGHQLSVSLPSVPLSVMASSSRLQQIVTNLLTNAAKFTDRGGKISLKIEAAADVLVVRVRDNGMGIAPDMLGRIFQMYQQVEGRADAYCGGLGIGLALVKSFAELHGGSVVAYSEGLGKGSEFIVRIPFSGDGDLARSALPDLFTDVATLSHMPAEQADFFKRNDGGQH